ncbi:MAG: hypothetical protein RH917_18785 [Lacipirellulaceae bacterium]
MQQTPFHGLDEWLGVARTEYEETLIVGIPLGDISVLDDKDIGMLGFIALFAFLVERFGSPDFPGGNEVDWRMSLNISDTMVAVWDFDYYQLSIRNSCKNQGVIITRH